MNVNTSVRVQDKEGERDAMNKREALHDRISDGFSKFKKIYQRRTPGDEIPPHLKSVKRTTLF